MRRVARLDPGLVAKLTDLVPLTYADGGSVGEDRPPHVRAASALRRRGARLVIVQDDVNVLSLCDAERSVEAVLLPLGPGARRRFDDQLGNKHSKMDLEACATLPDQRIVAFGSGSTEARKQLVVVDPIGTVRVIAAPELYAKLEAEPSFAGSELNIEGALVVGDALRLFQRGNGQARGELRPVNATGDFPLARFLSWLDSGDELPALQDIVEFDLGNDAGARFGFTDATLMPDGCVVFVACAEDSPDTVRDGAVLGCRIGLVQPDGVRMADVLDDEGKISKLKIEGIEARDQGSFDVVVDVDDPDTPALLGRITLELRSKE